MWSARNSVSSGTYQKQTNNISQGEHFSLAYMSKKSLNSRNWVFIFGILHSRHINYTKGLSLAPP